MSKLSISCTGCSLMDYLYNGIAFSGEGILPYLSLHEGDGGLIPGKLVFTEELERFAGQPYTDIIAGITGSREPDAMNIGGPGIVAMIHAAQLAGHDNAIRFYGAVGNDRVAFNLKRLLSATPLSDRYLTALPSSTPFTHVLSDPGYDGGHGERIFINHIGAAWGLDIPGPSFYDAGIVVFGGTALVPAIHDKLDILLGEAKKRGAFTIVNTVYDFRSQRSGPGKPWPLGKPGSLRNIDLLIMDREEALKISGTGTIGDAVDYFYTEGTAGIIITDGVRPARVRASGKIFRDGINGEFPVSETLLRELRDSEIRGDTTGCGDNFTGGVIYAVAEQLKRGATKPDLRDAVAWGMASGGFARFYLGGTYYETRPGEKMEKIRRYYRLYVES